MKVLHSITVEYAFGETQAADRLAQRLLPADHRIPYEKEEIVRATSEQPGYLRYSWTLDHVIPGKVES